VYLTDTYIAQNAYYKMSYHLGCTEDDIDMKKVVGEVQGYYDAQEKREWVEWVGKTLMPQLHTQIVMEKAGAARTEQEKLEEMRQQDEREQWAEKEAELDEKEAEYIRQMNAKEIDEDRSRELVGKLDLERAMGESVAEGPATTQVTMQDEEVGESEWDELAEEEPVAVRATLLS
jgi:hypothetical protein